MYTNSGKNRAYGGEYSIYYPVDPFAAELGFSYVKSEALGVASTPRASIARRLTGITEHFPNTQSYADSIIILNHPILISFSITGYI